MYFARKRASTTDERTMGIDTQDPFAASEVPVAGASLNPAAAPVTSGVFNATVATLDTTSIGYGRFGGQDLSDHFRFNAAPGTTYSLVVSTDSANGNIKTTAFADYFDLYFEDANGVRLTAGFQVKELDLRTKLVEYTVPGTGGSAVPLYVQVDNALQQPFEYAIALFDKAAAPRITVQATELADGRFQVTFASDMVLINSRPRVDRIAVEGGTLGTLVRSADGKGYTGLFTPHAVPAGIEPPQPRVQALSGSFFSLAGNPNLDGDEVNNGVGLVRDTTPPKVTQLDLLGPGLGASAKSNAPYVLTVTFSEPVEGFGLDDVSVEGGTAREVTGSGAVYQVKIDRAGDSRTITPTIKAGGYADTSPGRNKSVEPSSTLFTPDLVRPVARMESDKGELQPGERAVISLGFTEPVLGLEEARLGVEGGALVKGSLTMLDRSGLRYSFEVQADELEDATPNVTVLLADSENITDAAGNDVEPPMTLTLFGAQFYVPQPARPTEAGLEALVVNRHSGNRVTVMLSDGIGTTEDLELGVVEVSGQIQLLPLFEQVKQAHGSVVARDGLAERSLGLHLSLGTGGNDDFLAPTSGMPGAVYGFGGNDRLRDGAHAATLVGGEGVDRYELARDSGAPVLILETGSPLTRPFVGGVGPTASLPVVRDVFTGFDLVLGFNAASAEDRIHLLRAEDAPLRKARGVYETGNGTFRLDAAGADLMLFTDGPGGAVARPDVGERAVVIVGVGALMGEVGG